MKKDLIALQNIIEKLLLLEQDEPVVQPKTPQELRELISISLEDEGLLDQDLYEELFQLLKATPRTTSNRFFNQLFGGRNAKATIADMLASFVNGSMYTFKVGGPQILIEQEIINQVCSKIGFSNDSTGTIAPGGSMTNLMAMIMARDYKNNQIRYQGLQHKMTMYISDSSHYSLPKNASLIGLGREQVRYVLTNSKGEMDVNNLREMIEMDIKDGFEPFLVVATAGTTVMGAFDDIQACKTICRDHQMWLHVDGAYCGSVLFSNKYKHLIDGVNQANSFSFNAHKTLSVPLSCSIFVTPHKKQMRASFGNDASYLYQTADDDLNPGKISLQCGRRNDALKFWTLWKSVGTNGLEKIIDHHFEMASIARNYVQNNPDYTVYNFDETINICFNYKNYDPVDLCARLNEESKVVVGYGQFKKDVFVRLVAVNANNTKESILHFFNELESLAEAHKGQIKTIQQTIDI